MYSDPEYDWNYHTVPQVYADGQILAHPRGKQLGGSSAINFLFWTHASQQDLNNWGELGNKNWSWDNVDPYFSKSEEFVGPSAPVEQDLETEYIEPSLHGNYGPIANTFPDIYGPLDEAWPRTYHTLGLEVKSDPRNGLALGGYTNLINMDLKSRSRSYAATGYYAPIKQRHNLDVITGALVENIVLAKNNGDVRVTGVKYSMGNVSFVANAIKEVILCAGSIGSPQILELSGIGDPKLLKKHGIEIFVENENVGENLQDHAYIPLGYVALWGLNTTANTYVKV
jgi:choline dehydrogenase